MSFSFSEFQALVQEPRAKAIQFHKFVPLLSYSEKCNSSFASVCPFCEHAFPYAFDFPQLLKVPSCHAAAYPPCGWSLCSIALRHGFFCLCSKIYGLYALSFFLFNSNKIVFELPFDPFLNYFINDIKNPKRVPQLVNIYSQYLQC